MKKILTLAALAAITVATVVAATGSAQTTGGRTITLFENIARERSTLVDNAPKSPSKNPESSRFRLSAGDELVNRTPMLDRKGGARVGASYAHAIVVKGRRFESASLHANIVLALRDGTITLAGLVGAAQRPLAVTGGTGAYEGARGSATEKETGSGAELTIRLLP
jgi:hypothetical protein